MSSSSEWLTIAAVGVGLGLFASGATGSIKDDVIASCVAYNAEQGRQGARTNNFCICSGNRTAAKSNIVHRIGYQVGLFDLSSPYALGKKFGEETANFCNAIK